MKYEYKDRKKLPVCDFECTDCKHVTHLQIPYLKQFMIICCKGCSKCVVILDSTWAHPDRVETNGLSKLIKFDKWVIERMASEGFAMLGNTVGLVTNESVKHALVNKYNFDNPNDPIPVRYLPEK
jgi:hypothetical protein